MAKRGKYYKVSKFSFTGLDAQHYRTTEQYTRAVETLFERAAADVAHNTANINPGEKEFTFDDYPSAKKHMEKVAGQLAGKVTATIERGSRKEWLFACAKNDEFLESIMETSKVKKSTLKKMQDRNLDALETFQGRKVGGMNLSQRVWKYVDEWKDHLEMALDVGLGDGVSAAKLARDVRQDLKDPNRLFRRVRDKHGNLVLSKHARAFHPGQGVYRSSVKNAQRLTRSEINMAYRESDFKRWQQLDFVVGFEIVRSNHEPHFECPLCDRLAGKYPKTFKFVGWHPQCMCKAIPILMDDETFDANELGELRAALRGTEYKALQGKNAVTEMPDGFMEWVQENAERQANWSSTPYFIRDNFMNGNLKEGLKPAILDEERKRREKEELEKQRIALNNAVNNANSVISDIEQYKSLNIDYTELNDAIQAKDIDSINKKTEEIRIQVESKKQAVQTDAEHIVAKASEYKELENGIKDVESAIASKDYDAMDKYTAEIDKQIKQFTKDENELSDVLDNVHEWHKKFTIEELKSVKEKVVEKLATLESLPLAKQKDKLAFEADVFLGGNMNGVQQKYATWEVSQQAYKKKQSEVEDKLAINDIKAQLQTIVAWSALHPKSLKIIKEIEDVQEALNLNLPISDIQSVFLILQKDYNKHLSDEKYRKNKKLSKLDEFAQERKDNAVWDKHGGQQANDTLFPVASEAWTQATEDEKKYIYEYTYSYCNVNEPLQGRKYQNPQTREHFEEKVNNITQYIQRNELPEDMWFQRGDSSINVIASRLKFNGEQMPAKLEDLVGMVMQEGGFLSTASRKNAGFTCNPIILNIYAPKGTHAAYCEPFSQFGNGGKGNWDGKTRYTSFGHEHETLFQRGTKLRITKVEKSGGTIYIDCEVIEQEIRDLSYVPDSNVGY